jgi:hypothetical protein
VDEFILPSVVDSYSRLKKATPERQRQVALFSRAAILGDAQVYGGGHSCVGDRAMFLHDGARCAADMTIDRFESVIFEKGISISA